MLRHYLPSIAAIIALLLAMLIVPIGGELVSDKGTSLKTSTVLAQKPPPTEVIFEIKLFDPTEKTIKLPNPYEFARPAEIRSVHSIYCCFSGNIKLYLEDILVNEQQKTLHSCERCGNDSEAVDWVIPPGRIADKIEQPGAIAEGDVKFIDILGRRTDTVSVNDLAKTIDR